MKKILIVDDEIEMLESLKKILSYRKEFELTLVNDSQQGLDLVQKQKFDLIISDLKMHPVSGLEILKGAVKNFPDSLVIMISGYGTIEASVEAIRSGSFDFIEKPFTSKRLFSCIDRAFKEQEMHSPSESDESTKTFSGIIYKSKEMADIIEVVKKIAPGDINVLITGESGTGKELVARAIHNLSKSNLDLFVPVNCGALPENLFESELFGHERGAFTGAIKRKPGLLEFANNGTFFFDEIGELTQSLQVKLLRMLEERKIRRIGGQEEIKIDVRIISASNRDLEKAVQEKTFREDLFYRLSTFQIEVPPLRERTDDIIPLAKHYLREICKKNDYDEKRFTVDAEKALQEYTWPGNVRELQNVIGRTFILSSGNIIEVENLPIPFSNQNKLLISKFIDLDYVNAKEAIFEKFEVEYLTYHLKNNAGNISKTAEECGMDRRTIHRLIKKYNIIYKHRDDN